MNTSVQWGVASGDERGEGAGVERRARAASLLSQALGARATTRELSSPEEFPDETGLQRSPSSERTASMSAEGAGDRGQRGRPCGFRGF